MVIAGVNMTPKGMTLLAAGAVAIAACASAPLGLSAPQIRVPPQADAVISGVSILNPGTEALRDQTIVINAGRIAEIRPRIAGDPEPECPGCVAMPGLIDAHIHNPPKLALGNQELFALMYLANGVTTVRDVGATDDSVGALASRLNTGRLVGPRMFWCGRVLESAPLSFGSAREVDTAEQAELAVSELADQGVNCIKIYNNLKPEPYRAIRETAAKRGLPVIGHVPHQVGIANVFDFEAQHFTGVPYVRGGETPPHSDFRDVDWLTMTDAEIGAALDLAKAHRISFLPTLANGRLRLIASEPDVYPPTSAARYLPKIWTKAWNSQTTIASHPTGEVIDERLKRNPLFLKVAGMARDRGIDVLAGTDTLMPWVVPGEALLLEIDDLAQAFGSPDAALAAATVVNARHIAPGEIGILAVGARADILLLQSNPTEDLGALRKWTILYADGRRYDRATVDKWLERYRRHFRSTGYGFVMGLASDFVAAGRGRTPDPPH
jgi:hypothetical protein